jgi:drug/metabolite transporter (DMT)-like permease
MCFSGWHIVGSIALVRNYSGYESFLNIVLETRGRSSRLCPLSRYCLEIQVLEFNYLPTEIFASILMFFLVKYQKKIIRIEPKDYSRILFLGFFSFVNVVGTILALQYISAVRYSVMQPIIPVIATMISVMKGLEILTVYKALGICCAVGGAMLVELWHSGNEGGNSNIALGTALVCVQVTAMASLIVFQKPLLSRYDPAVLTFVYYSTGSG